MWGRKLAFKSCWIVVFFRVIECPTTSRSLAAPMPPYICYSASTENRFKPTPDEVFSRTDCGSSTDIVHIESIATSPDPAITG
ncbi:hypothetical protein A0H81_09364 [Grifola frondosa]|uniref:Secreted protein n=1 Tax=Grifola frondosa TaxID=5627 RepID=A0A1C7M3C0_GRIFR|nr:hypothetical protein A0H81_09364 [Grifola frondosa]